MKTNATAWALLMLGIAASPALADKASDARMAEEALLAHVRTKDPGMRNAHIENFQLGVETAALRAPDEARSATVIFNRGLVANEVVKLLEANGQTPIRYDFKAPVGTDGTVNSLSIGTDDLLRFDGNMGTQLEYAIALARGRMLKMAEGMEGNDGAEYRQMALGPLAVYKVEVFGKASDIKAVSQRNDVRVVILDDDDRKIRAYPKAQEKTRTPH